MIKNDGMETNQSTGELIYSYVTERGVRFSWLASKVGLNQSSLSRALRDKGRFANERLTPELVGQIARVLDVSRAIEAEWLALLDQPVAVPA